MDNRAHWENVYRTKAPDQVGWYQEYPRLSLSFIQRTGIDQAGHIVDAGGGSSTLVDHLLDSGFQCITVLDISGAALQMARQRLGERAAQVAWIEADAVQPPLPSHGFDIWHDRAMFHFLTQPEQRQRYVQAVRHAVKPGGHLILAAFALDGPPRCSGLEVARYSPAGLQRELGEGFWLVDSAREAHVTPSGSKQAYTYCYFRRG